VRAREWAQQADAKSGRDQAREAVEKEKQERELDEMVKHSHAVVPDDFPVTAPPATPAFSPQG
jgi:hypothetical protein